MNRAIVEIPSDGRVTNVHMPSANDAGLALGNLILVLAVTLAIVIAALRGRQQEH